PCRRAGRGRAARWGRRWRVGRSPWLLASSWRSPGLPGEAQGALADDVPLDLARAGVDGVGPAEQEQPAQGGDLLGVAGALAVAGHRRGAEHVHGQLAQLLVERRPVELGDQRLAAERARRAPGQRAQGVEAHDLEADVGPGEPLADPGVPGPAGAAGGGDDGVQLVAEGELLAEGRHAPLEREGAHGDLPALALAADDVGRRRAGAVEEDLVELAVPGDLDDGPHLDPRLAHGHEQVGDAGVAAGGVARPGAGEDEAPVGPEGVRRPHLLAVDHPLVAVELGPGGDVGQVAPRAGLGVPLAPQLGAGGDGRQEPLLLLGRAEGDERRPEQGLADVAEPAGRPGPGVLLVEDDLLPQRQAAPAVLLGPADAGPAVGAEVPLPGEALLEQRELVARAAPAADHREVAPQALLEEGPHLVAEGPVLRRLPEIHAQTVSDTPSGIDPAPAPRRPPYARQAMAERVPHLASRLQGFGTTIFAEMTELAARTG